MVSDWAALRQNADNLDATARGRGVQAANTYAPSLNTQFLIDGAVTKLQNRWAALACLSREFSTDQYKPLAVGNLKFITSTDGLVQVNATNFESGDTTASNCQITPAQYSRGFHVSNTDLQSGLRLDNLLDINLALMADQIIGVVAGVITGANFPTPALVVPPGNFAWGNMQSGWGLLKKSPIKNAILDGEYLAQIINVPSQFQRSGAGPSNGGAWSAFGWDNIALNTNWTNADPNTRGFICGPTAIGCLAGLPVEPMITPGNTLKITKFKIPGPDIYLALYEWFSLSERTAWNSFDLMFGASLLDSLAGLLIKSA
jgi:hypothetical protein